MCAWCANECVCTCDGLVHDMSHDVSGEYLCAYAYILMSVCDMYLSVYVMCMCVHGVWYVQ